MFFSLILTVATSVLTDLLIYLGRKLIDKYLK